MSADKVDREHPLDALWRLGLEDLVGRAEAPDRVWARLRGQVGGGPSRPQRLSRAASPVWRAASQFIALAAVCLLLLGVRAEVVPQGAGEATFWHGRLPTPWAWPAATPPLRVGLGDTLSSHAAYTSAREQRALASLRSPSRDPVLRNQGAGLTSVAQGPALPSPQVQVPQHGEASVAAPREEALRVLGEPARDPLLTRQAR